MKKSKNSLFYHLKQVINFLSLPSPTRTRTFMGMLFIFLSIFATVNLLEHQTFFLQHATNSCSSLSGGYCVPRGEGCAQGDKPANGTCPNTLPICCQTSHPTAKTCNNFKNYCTGDELCTCNSGIVSCTPSQQCGYCPTITKHHVCYGQQLCDSISNPCSPHASYSNCQRISGKCGVPVAGKPHPDTSILSCNYDDNPSPNNTFNHTASGQTACSPSQYCHGQSHHNNPNDICFPDYACKCDDATHYHCQPPSTNGNLYKGSCSNTQYCNDSGNNVDTTSICQTLPKAATSPNSISCGDNNLGVCYYYGIKLGPLTCDPSNFTMNSSNACKATVGWSALPSCNTVAGKGSRELNDTKNACGNSGYHRCCSVPIKYSPNPNPQSEDSPLQGCVLQTIILPQNGNIGNTFSYDIGVQCPQNETGYLDIDCGFNGANSDGVVVSSSKYSNGRVSSIHTPAIMTPKDYKNIPGKYNVSCTVHQDLYPPGTTNQVDRILIPNETVKNSQFTIFSPSYSGSLFCSSTGYIKDCTSTTSGDSTCTKGDFCEVKDTNSCNQSGVASPSVKVYSCDSNGHWTNPYSQANNKCRFPLCPVKQNPNSGKPGNPGNPGNGNQPPPPHKKPKNTPTPTPSPSVNFTSTICGGTDANPYTCTTDPSGKTIISQTTVPSRSCGYYGTKAGLNSGSSIYCCSTGSGNYSKCGQNGIGVCTTDTSCAPVSPTPNTTPINIYTDTIPTDTCAIAGAKAGLGEGVTVFCVCTGTNCPTPTPTLTPTPISSGIAGDINGDGVVDILDYDALLSCFGTRANTPSCVNKQAADLNGDGVIDGLDYNLFLRDVQIAHGK